MKKVNYWMMAIMFLFLASCGEKKVDIVCDGECAFVLEETIGEMMMLNCFEKYGIKTIHPDDGSVTIYGIPDEVKEEFQVEGKAVTFTAKFRPNTLQPIFPDPDIGPETLYEIELISLD